MSFTVMARSLLFTVLRVVTWAALLGFTFRVFFSGKSVASSWGSALISAQVSAAAS